jgi:enamine deaminase RidA (YjgF/YER057c/UK114 family)
MNTLRACLGVAVLWLTVAAFASGADEALGGKTLSVRVPDGPLYFSAQVMARDLSRDAATQASEAAGRLLAAVVAAGGSAESVARINLYLADAADVEAAERAVRARFGAARPTMTVVVTSLPEPGARVALDAVAAVAGDAERVRTVADGAVLPAGAKVFLSGLVERGNGMVEGVGRTMDGLGAMLTHLGLAWRDVVQVKAFIQPYAERAVAEREIAARFAGGPVPPVVWVEWTQNQPAEIELVAGGRALAPAPSEPLSFPDFPGRTRSARYSHAAVVAAGTPLIFFDGLTPPPGLAPREQWKPVFAHLGTTLFEAGSGFRFLVKATYYTSDAEARRVLNDIRAVYYDPARPPAASAIGVRHVGREGAVVNFDLIAVPIPGPR